MAGKLFKNKIAWLLIVIILAHGAINFLWLKIDKAPQWFDSAGYFKRSINIFDASKTGPFDFIKEILGVRAEVYHPHRVLLPFVTLPYYYFFGISEDIAVMSQFLFLAIVLFLTYIIGARIFNKKTGLLAAFILSVSPGFFTNSRRYIPEFAATALVITAVYFLLRSRDFQDRKFSLLFGVSAGLSMITKETAFAFYPSVVLLAVWRNFIAYKKSGFHTESLYMSLKNAFFALGLALMIIFPFYWFHRYAIFDRVFNIAFDEAVGYTYYMPKVASFKGFTLYAWRTYSFYILPVNFIFLCVGIFLSAGKRFENKTFIFCWAGISYFMLSLAAVKTHLYFIPLLIPLSIFAAEGVVNLFKNQAMKILTVTIVVLFSIIEFWAYSFPLPACFNGWKFIKKPVQTNKFLYYPEKADWQLDAVVEYMKDNFNKKEAPILTHMGANLFNFSPVALESVALRKRCDMLVSWDDISPFNLDTANYVILKTGGDQGIFFDAIKADNLKRRLFSSGFFVKEPKRFLLPDGSYAEVYMRI